MLDSGFSGELKRQLLSLLLFTVGNSPLVLIVDAAILNIGLGTHKQFEEESCKARLLPSGREV